MAAQDEIKDVTKPTNPATTPTSELREDDLEAVTGGVGTAGGSSLSSGDTEVCISSD